MIDFKTWYNDYIEFIKSENAYCDGFAQLEKIYAWAFDFIYGNLP